MAQCRGYHDDGSGECLAQAEENGYCQDHQDQAEQDNNDAPEGNDNPADEREQGGRMSKKTKQTIGMIVVGLGLLALGAWMLKDCERCGGSSKKSSGPTKSATTDDAGDDAGGTSLPGVEKSRCEKQGCCDCPKKRKRRYQRRPRRVVVTPPPPRKPARRQVVQKPVPKKRVVTYEIPAEDNWSDVGVHTPGAVGVLKEVR